MNKQNLLEKSILVSEAITYLLLVAALIFLSTFYRTGLFVFFLILVVLLPLASYLVGRFCHSRLSLKISTSTAYAESGDKVLLSLLLDNPTVFPLPDCEIGYSITSSFYPCDKTFSANCPSFARTVFSFDLPLEMQRCGSYQIRLTSLKFYDYLHFFKFEKELSCLSEVFIFPPEKEMPLFEPSDYGEGFDEFEETSAKGNTSSNVTDIREYIPGDRLQKIHWKLTAKTGKLMVKENEHTSSNQFTLLIELFLAKPEDDTLEESLKTGYSLGLSLIRAGQPFFLCFYQAGGGDFFTTLIQNKEQLDTAFSECFYFAPYPEEGLGLSVYTRAGLAGGTILHVTHQGVEDVLS